MSAPTVRRGRAKAMLVVLLAVLAIPFTMIVLFAQASGGRR